MGIKIILVSKEGKAKRAYLEAIEPFEVQVDTVSTFKELRKRMIENSYNGVMMDLKTKIKEQKKDEELTVEILEQFPLVQLRYEDKTGSIGALSYGRSGPGEALETFIREECGSFRARPIRSDVRKKINFNVILSKTGDFSNGRLVRTVTINVSRGGCFIFSTENRRAGSRLLFIVKELKDDTPIRGKVRWIKPWGKKMQIPGMGVQYEGIRENQLEEICDRGRLS